MIDPFFVKEGASVKKVEYFGNEKQDDIFVGITVTSNNNKKDIIFNGASETDSYKTDKVNFTGRYALVRLSDNQPEYLLLGEGKLIQYGDWKIENSETENSVSIELLKREMKITSEKKFRLTVPVQAFNI